MFARKLLDDNNNIGVGWESQALHNPPFDEATATTAVAKQPSPLSAAATSSRETEPALIAVTTTRTEWENRGQERENALQPTVRCLQRMKGHGGRGVAAVEQRKNTWGIKAAIIQHRGSNIGLLS